MSAYEAYSKKCIETFTQYAKLFHEYIETFARAYGYRGARGRFSIGWNTEYSSMNIPKVKFEKPRAVKTMRLVWIS